MEHFRRQPLLVQFALMIPARKSCGLGEAHRFTGITVLDFQHTMASPVNSHLHRHSRGPIAARAHIANDRLLLYEQHAVCSKAGSTMLDLLWGPVSRRFIF